jgi:hypothetical protein
MRSLQRKRPGGYRAAMRALLIPGMIAACAATPLAAQQLPVGDPFEDYVRVLGLIGRADPGGMVIRPLDWGRAAATIADTGHPWAGRLPRHGEGLILDEPWSRLGYSSAVPEGRNDGALWQGRGATLGGGWGATWRRGGLTVTLRPAAYWVQNREFALSPLAPPPATSPWAYPYHRGGSPAAARIDMPQRFGPDAFTIMDAGQSSVRLSWRGFAAGGGTENLWWGPGARNAIIMSNNAGGFPHVSLGSARPVSIGAGRVEARAVWGRLHESEWYDTIPGNDSRYLTGAVGTWEPSFMPGLHLGATRLFFLHFPDGGLSFSEYFLVLQGVTKQSQTDSLNPSGNDLRDQMLSLFARWVHPASGFEVWTEWARNDHSRDLRDFVNEPEHTQGYTLGFQKAVALSSGRVVRLLGELTHLERSVSKVLRPTPSFYSHHIVRQGFTHRGQVVGAALGPGGNSQFLGADFFTRHGRFGGWLERRIVDNDALREDTLAPVQAFRRHRVVLGGGISAVAFAGDWTVVAELGYGVELNRYYLYENDVGNFTLRLLARRRLGGPGT